MAEYRDVLRTTTYVNGSSNPDETVRDVGFIVEDAEGAVSDTVFAEVAVTGINSAPTFDAGGNVAVDEDSGAYAAAWATNIADGDGGGQLLSFVIDVNDNPALFAVPPAISATGVVAPCVFERSLDGAVFTQWVEDWLLPALPPGTTIVLDNLSVHRNPAVRAAVDKAGCQLRFLPAYSPDFNPIELVFAHLKTHVRGRAARTFDAVVDAIGIGLNAVTPAHLRAYYRHCGYALPEKPSQPP